jgi:hypothetical protein
MIERLSLFPEFVESGRYTTCFVDTSVLFSASYPFDHFNESAEFLFSQLFTFQLAPFTNVNVNAEFLENHRRVLIPECLCDFYEDFEGELEEDLAEFLWKHRKNYRQSMSDERAVKFDGSKIANFKRRLSKFQSSQGRDGWTVFCEEYLDRKFQPIWDNTESNLGLNLISIRDSDKSPYLDSVPDWPEAISVMGRYGIASNDAMILNMVLCSKIPVLFTADLEMAEVANKESKGRKLIFLPDEIYPGAKK